MAKATRLTSEPAKAVVEAPGEVTTLVNFGSSPRVLHDTMGRSFMVPIGGVATRKLPTQTIKRIKQRTPTLMALPAELVEHTEAPLLRTTLDALRDFDGLSNEDALFVHDKVFGRGGLSMRPTKPEIRLALAKRCRDAAEYIAAGAYETAAKLLGKGRPEPVHLAASTDGPGLSHVDPDLVQGDKDEDEHDDAGDTGSGDGNREGGNGDAVTGQHAGAGGDGGGAEPERVLSGDGKPGSDAAPGEPEGQGEHAGDGTPRRVHSTKQNEE